MAAAAVADDMEMKPPVFYLLCTKKIHMHVANTVEEWNCSYCCCCCCCWWTNGWMHLVVGEIDGERKKERKKNKSGK